MASPPSNTVATFTAILQPFPINTNPITISGYVYPNNDNGYNAYLNSPFNNTITLSSRNTTNISTTTPVTIGNYIGGLIPYKNNEIGGVIGINLLSQSEVNYVNVSSSITISETVFSPAATSQAATTKTQTSALLSLLDPRGMFITNTIQENIVHESGKIAAHFVSIGEGINNIGAAIAKK